MAKTCSPAGRNFRNPCGLLGNGVVSRFIRLACRLHGPAFDFRFRFGVSHFTSRAFLQELQYARGYLEVVDRQNAYRLGLKDWRWICWRRFFRHTVLDRSGVQPIYNPIRTVVNHPLENVSAPSMPTILPNGHLGAGQSEGPSQESSQTSSQ